MSAPLWIARQRFPPQKGCSAGRKPGGVGRHPQAVADGRLVRREVVDVSLVSSVALRPLEKRGRDLSPALDRAREDPGRSSGPEVVCQPLLERCQRRQLLARCGREEDTGSRERGVGDARPVISGVLPRSRQRWEPCQRAPALHSRDDRLVQRETGVAEDPRGNRRTVAGCPLWTSSRAKSNQVVAMLLGLGRRRRSARQPPSELTTTPRLQSRQKRRLRRARSRAG